MFTFILILSLCLTRCFTVHVPRVYGLGDALYLVFSGMPVMSCTRVRSQMLTNLRTVH